MITNEQKAELFDYMMSKAHYRAERRPNGKRLLEIGINANSGFEMDQLIHECYSELRQKKSKSERYREFLKLKREFENDPI